eukprot:CAMPEP_0172860238 /NCGR_PEP_ID=MMETSP1075-20121228/71972_1 /TAXON_ID=2916 /ORGANISM="Ceratium fusus, Strain PA161109" /LENGTH=52 /DNA_ID=CAMNT_0013708239 /DNA_START=169 /DNA_END=327 /DNA_ORIENTATION=-
MNSKPGGGFTADLLLSVFSAAPFFISFEGASFCRSWCAATAAVGSDFGILAW